MVHVRVYMHGFLSDRGSLAELVNIQVSLWFRQVINPVHGGKRLTVFSRDPTTI